MDRHALGYGFFSVTPLPGQPQVAVCHDFTVLPQFRGQGNGHRLKAYQMDILKGMFFDHAICTVRQDNHAQVEILQQAGWEKQAEFINRRNGDHTEVWGWEVPK